MKLDMIWTGEKTKKTSPSFNPWHVQVSLEFLVTDPDLKSKAKRLFTLSYEYVSLNTM